MREGVVVRETRARGFFATGAGLADRRLVGMLVASLALHAVFSPFPALVEMLSWLAPPERVDEVPVDAIPLDLLEEGPEVAAPPPTPPPPANEPSSLAPVEKDPAAPKVPPEPKPREPSKSVPATEPDKKPVAEAAPEGAIGDPIALSGLAGKLADSNANVRLLLHTAPIRQSDLGAQIGGLLRRTPQWADFFGGTDIDPIRDLDHILVAGPQLRDSSNVVAVVQHHLPAETVEGAVQALVERDGEWLTGARHKLARATVDRAARIFALPSPKVVAIVPPSAEKSARKLPKNLGFSSPKDGAALTAYVVTPYRVARGLPVKIPESIAWAKASVVEVEGGGVEIRIEAADASDEMASQNAHQLERMLRAATELDFSKLGGIGSVGSFLFGKKKQRFVETIEFRSEGKRILGTLGVTRAQLGTILGLLDGYLPPERVRKPRVLPVPPRPEDEEATPPRRDEGTAPAPTSRPTGDGTPAPSEGAPTEPAPAPADSTL